MPPIPSSSPEPAGIDELQRRALLDFAVSQSGTVFYVAELGGQRRTRFISDNVLRLTGHPAEAFTSQPGYGRRQLHPDDLAGYAAAIDRLHRVGELTLEYRFRRPDGRWVWFRDTLKVADAAEGEPAVLGCMVDISAEKAAVARVDTAEAITRALLANAMDAIVATDQQGLVVEFNPAAEQLFGHCRSEALGRPLSELIVPPEYRERHAAGMRRYQHAGRLEHSNRRMEVEAMRADGSTFPVELTISMTDTGANSLVIGEIRDISERIAAREERRRLIQLMTDAIDALPDGFVVSDADDRILFCNTAFARPYGTTPEALTGSSPDVFIPVFFPNLRQFAGRLVEGDESQIPWVVERLLVVGGPPIELELTDGSWREISRHRTSDGGSVTLRADITHRKRAELALRDSEALIRRILEASPVSVGMTRASDGLILYESPASRRLFLRDPIVGDLSARSFFVKADDRDRYVDILNRDGAVEGFETFLRRTDGTEFCASISARLIEYQGEAVVVSSVLDMTERRRVEAEMARQREALHQSEKLSALG
jgi:PAS domain S-box-containing protein